MRLGVSTSRRLGVSEVSEQGGADGGVAGGEAAEGGEHVCPVEPVAEVGTEPQNQAVEADCLVLGQPPGEGGVPGSISFRRLDAWTPAPGAVVERGTAALAAAPAPVLMGSGLR